MPWETMAMMPFVMGLVALICGPAAIVLIVWLLVRNAAKRRTEQHQERMAMIDKGLLTPEMTGDANNIAAPERRLMKGITFASIGMAVTLWFIFMGEGGGTILGLIPLFLGLSWIAFYVVGHLSPPREEDRLDQTQTESGEGEVQPQEEHETSGPSVNH